MALLGLAKRMYMGTLATSDATLYTAPSITPGALIKQIVIVNTDAAAQTVSIGINGSAATAGNNMLANTLSVPPNNTVTIDLSQVLNSGDTIHGLASKANSINVTISGLE